MNTYFKKMIFLAYLSFTVFAIAKSVNAQGELDTKDFGTPPPNAGVHTWWHWMDGNISKDGITQDLEAMKKQGIVQATILSVGLLGDTDYGVEKIDFASPEWYELFKWALTEANRLGISIGVHNCDGWSSSGGPWITPEMAMKEYTWTKTIVGPSSAEDIFLRKPLPVLDFYEDVAVVAVRNEKKANSFQQASPTAFLNDTDTINFIFDGCPTSSAKIGVGAQITFKFDRSFQASKITILPRKTFIWGNMNDYRSTYRLSSSNDGHTFKKLVEFTIKELNKINSFSFGQTAANYFRLELVDSNNLDSWLPYSIAECELLSAVEEPLLQPEIDFFFEKTATVKMTGKDVFNASSDNPEISAPKEVVDLTGKMDADGKLNWKPESGNWTVYRFGYTTTGAENSSATAAGVGLECDKMDTTALNSHFDHFVGQFIDEAGSYVGNTFKFVLVDSWECGFQNWTSNMLSEFENLNGYSLVGYIPVLCGETLGDAETDEAFLYDLRKTIAHLIEKNYYKHFSDLLHRNNLELHAEVIYGNTSYPPLDILKTTQYVDLPMYEFWSTTDRAQNLIYHPSDRVELHMPAFAAIGYEKPVLGAEAYTGLAHYSEYPGGLKPFGDRAFCSGINQMVLHSYVHQPSENQPGLTLGQFGSHFNRHNPYWAETAAWFNYQARIQYILQQGYQHQDVLYFLGDQLPQYIDYNQSNRLPFGYSFNACNADILKNRIQVKNGKIILNGKSEYAVLCLPEFEFIHFETLKRIAELVENGAIVYGPKPRKMLSLSDVKNRRAEFEQLAHNLWGEDDSLSNSPHSCGKGRVYSGISIEEVLLAEKVYPDLKASDNDDLTLMFIHKKVANEDVYFVMNQQNKKVRREIAFRITNKTPEIWNPETGTIIKPAVFSIDDNYTTLPVEFEAYQSFMFVFKDDKPENFIDQVKQKGIQIFPAVGKQTLVPIPLITTSDTGFVVTSSTNEEFLFVSNTSQSYTLKPFDIDEFVISDISGRITFDPAYSVSIKPVEFNGLKWLTEYHDPEVRYFSGKATYESNFNYPVTTIQKNDSVFMDLGEFASIARVTLNGVDLGTLWKAGQQKSVKAYLKESNSLKITVSNTYRNRLIGDYKQFGELKNLKTSAPITMFLNAKSQLSPSGLKGPLKIIKVRNSFL